MRRLVGIGYLDAAGARCSGRATLEQRIKEICQTRMRCGYRRVHVVLRRKMRRICRELGLQLRCLSRKGSFSRDLQRFASVLKCPGR
jgi:hypothetical protein